MKSVSDSPLFVPKSQWPLKFDKKREKRGLHSKSVFDFYQNWQDRVPVKCQKFQNNKNAEISEHQVGH